jgi:predicted PurR-regulated permease PerM
MVSPGRTENWFFLALLAIAAVLSWFVFQPYAGALVLAGTLAFLFKPVYRGVFRIVRNESVSALFVILIVILIVFLPLIYFGIQIIGEASGLYGSLTAGTLTGSTGITASGGLGVAVTSFLRAAFPNIQVSDITLNFNDVARQALGWFLQNLGLVFSGIAQSFFAVLVSLIGLFYFLRDGEQLKEWVLVHAPLARDYSEQVFGEMETVVRSVIEGMLVVAVIQGIIVGAGFFIFHVPNPAFWGALTVIVTLVPIVGTWLVAIPGVLYLFLTGQTVLAIGLLVWSGVLVNLAYNLITPQFVRRKADIHPYIILLSILGGIGFFGPIGFLMGPFIVALLFSLLRIYPKATS